MEKFKVFNKDWIPIINNFQNDLNLKIKRKYFFTATNDPNK